MKHDIVVVGGSYGGVDALIKLFSAIPSDIEASFFVTLHTAPTGPSYLTDILASVCALPVITPKDNEPIRPRQVYVATPNLHLIIKRGYIRNRFLPKENGTRPAIDPMFRSAALSYARRVIGVLLTGGLDDGTAGLGVIHDEGGLTIVQDPEDAVHPDMPLSAIKNTQPDHVVPLAEIAPLLVRLVEEEVTGNLSINEEETKELAEVMTCPGCGGIVHEYQDGKTVWYQCRVGHRFTSESMMIEQSVSVEEIFWRTLAILKEKEDLIRTMAADARSSLDPLVNAEYFEKQLHATKEAQKRIADMLDELGPFLFPGISKKDPANK